MSTTRTTPSRHPAQYLALGIGVLYTIIGIWGFFLTGFDGFVAPDGELLLGLFEVNPLHNLVHLVIGLAGIALWPRLETARIYGWLLAIGYGATLIFGLLVANTDDPANVLAINTPDNWLHGISAIAGLVIALWPADRRRDGTGTRPQQSAAERDDLRIEHDARDRERR